MTDDGETHTTQANQPEAPSAIGLLYRAFIERHEGSVVDAAIERALRSTIRGPEARGVVLTAGSGAGKTVLLDRITRKHSMLGEGPESPCRFVKMKVPAPCSLKDLGRLVAAKAGYTIAGSSHDATTIWNRARNELREAKIRFIWFDEIQNVTEPAKKGDDQLIRNTLKDLLINSEWPVGLILTGQPSVVSFLEADSQVRRRMGFTRLEPLTPKSIPHLVRAMTSLAAPLGIVCEEDGAADMAARLVHASDKQFGFAIEIVRKAIEIAAERGPGSRLGREHFAREYAERTGNAAFANPFLAKDWAAINPRRCNITKPEEIVEEAPHPPSRPGRRRASK